MSQRRSGMPTPRHSTATSPWATPPAAPARTSNRAPVICSATSRQCPTRVTSPAHPDRVLMVDRLIRTHGSLPLAWPNTRG